MNAKKKQGIKLVYFQRGHSRDSQNRVASEPPMKLSSHQNKLNPTHYNNNLITKSVRKKKHSNSRPGENSRSKKKKKKEQQQHVGVFSDLFRSSRVRDALQERSSHASHQGRVPECNTNSQSRRVAETQANKDSRTRGARWCS